MAKRDVNLYFLEMQAQYMEMLQVVKEFDAGYKAGDFTKEQFEQAQKEVNKLKENLDRIAYIVMLMNKPRDPKNKSADLYKSWYDSLTCASKEAIMDESRDVLKDFKELVKQKKVK